MLTVNIISLTGFVGVLFLSIVTLIVEGGLGDDEDLIMGDATQEVGHSVWDKSTPSSTCAANPDCVTVQRWSSTSEYHSRRPKPINCCMEREMRVDPSCDDNGDNGEVAEQELERTIRFSPR